MYAGGIIQSGFRYSTQNYTKNSVIFIGKPPLIYLKYSTFYTFQEYSHSFVDTNKRQILRSLANKYSRLKRYI